MSDTVTETGTEAVIRKGATTTSVPMKVLVTDDDHYYVECGECAAEVDVDEPGQMQLDQLDHLKEIGWVNLKYKFPLSTLKGEPGSYWVCPECADGCEHTP